MTERLDERTMLERAARAAGKVDLHGPRGVSMINHQETEALVALATCLGLVAAQPGAPMPDVLMVSKREVAA